MSEQKNIDRLFQEKLRDLEVSPSPEIWNAIENKLQKKKRRIIPIWWLSSGVAALLVVGVLVFPFTDDDNGDIIDTNIVTGPKKIELKQVEIENKYEIKNPKKNNGELVVKQSKIENIKVNTIIKKANSEHSINDSKLAFKEENDNKETKSISSYDNTGIQNNVNSVKSNKEEYTSEDKKINYAEKQEESKKENVFIAEINRAKQQDTIKKQYSKWSVTPTVGVIASNSFSRGSALSEELKNNKVKGNQSISYGVTISYKLNSKFSIQSGIHLQETGFNTQNVAILSGSTVSDVNQFNVNVLDNIIVVNSSDENDSITTGAGINKEEGSLEQRYTYLEVPVEIKYTVFKTRKLESSIISGFSTLFLTNNSVAFESQLSNRNLGKATNLNSVNFSGNIGVDLNIKLSKKVKLNITPMLKVPFNTFSKNSTEFSSYTFGGYTGISYEF